jgi:hypothetical protein
VRAGLGAPETFSSLLVSRAGLSRVCPIGHERLKPIRRTPMRAGLGFRTSRPGRNNALGQAHSPAIELRLKNCVVSRTAAVATLWRALATSSG